jgi:hypothetical protein
VLNEEQLVLLATRASVEKQLLDVDQIKALLEEVAVSTLEKEVDVVETPSLPSVAVVPVEVEEKEVQAQVEVVDVVDMSLEVIAKCRVEIDEVTLTHDTHTYMTHTYRHIQYVIHMTQI